MPILNLTSAKKLYYGSNLVQKLYLGNQLLYPNPADPYFNNVVLYLKGNSFNDYSPNPKNITVNGNVTLSNEQIRSSNSSVKFGYRNPRNYLSIPMSSDFHLTGDCTIEAWAFCNDTSQNEIAHHRIVDNCKLNNFGGESYNLILYQDSLQFWSGSFSSTTAVIKSSTTPPLNQWNHLAFTREGNVNRLFVNKVKAAENTINWVHIFVPDSLFLVGRFIGLETFFSGYIDSLRITKGIARDVNTFLE